ncbi:MAG: hypothetical protein GYB68_12270, partial [Chloroflexi bacterium]|nr:hypothetical protein [Chloroflexota bacterium]
FPLRVALGSVALLLSILTFTFNADNTFSLPGVLAWLASILLWMICLSERDPLEAAQEAATKLRSFKPADLMPKQFNWPVVLALVSVIALAAFFRLYRLEAVPAEMTSDHVEKLLDAYRVQQGTFNVFFTNNGGREAIQFYLIAAVDSLLGTGINHFTLKLVTVAEALLLIPLVVLLGRELIDRDTGFLAAGLVAVSWWHTLLARLGLRIVLTPLFFTLVLITLIRGMRTASRRPWLWAGFWMGVGVYGYQAMRMVPLVAIAAFLIAVAGPVITALRAGVRTLPDAPQRWEVARRTVLRQSLNLVAAGLVALAIFVPMLRVWRDAPDQLWNRVINRVTENEVSIEGTAAGVFAENYADALRMFNVQGDVAWISAVPNLPTLDVIAGMLLILGVMVWLVRLRLRGDPVDLFFIVAGLIMLLPSALAIAFPIENPSNTRASGLIPIVFMLAAWPLSLMRAQFSRVLSDPYGAIAGWILVAMLIFGSAALSFNIYFQDFDATYQGSALNPSEVADAVREEIGEDAPLDGVFLIGFPFWHDYRAIGIEAGNPEFGNAIFDNAMLDRLLSGMPDMFRSRPLVLIVHPDDELALDRLSSEFPGAEVRFVEGSTPGKDFVLFIVRG